MVFSVMLEEGANISEAVSIMEAIGMGIIEIEAMLESGSTRSSDKSYVEENEEELWGFSPEDDNENFPELVSYEKVSKKNKVDKAKKEMRKKSLKW